MTDGKLTSTQFWLGLVGLLVLNTLAGTVFAPTIETPEINVPPAEPVEVVLDYDALANAVWAKQPVSEDDESTFTVTEKEDIHEAACLELAEDELTKRSFLKDLADAVEIDDWEDIDDVTFRDYDVDGFSRSNMRNTDCEITLEKVRVHYDGDELEKGEIVFAIEDGEVDDDETEFDF